MSLAVAYNDLGALSAIAAQGFAEWGDPVRIGSDIAAGFAKVIGTSALPDGALAGVLILSLAPRLIPPMDWAVTGHSGALNLGCPTIRYPAKAQIDANLRGRSRLTSAREHPRGTLITLDFEVQEVGANEPCMTAQSELLYLAGKPQ